MHAWIPQYGTMQQNKLQKTMKQIQTEVQNGTKPPLHFDWKVLNKAETNAHIVIAIHK